MTTKPTRPEKRPQADDIVKNLGPSALSWAGETEPAPPPPSGEATRGRLQVVDSGWLANRLADRLGNPALPDLQEPDGYLIDTDGVWTLDNRGNRGRRIVLAPLLICGRYADCDTQHVSLGLTWRSGGRWVVRVLDRAQAMDHRALLALAGEGAPINSAEARDVVAFLARFEAANADALPSGYSTRRLGWVGRRDSYFMAGDQQLSAGEPEHAVRVSGDAGAQQLAEAVRSRGTWEGWKAAISTIEGYPLAYTAIYASLAAPLLKILGNKNFVLDFWGRSGHGKTTTLRLAASAWGVPEVSAGTILPWKGTETRWERAAAFLCDMPMCMDDTKMLSDKEREAAGAFVFTFASGASKGRGTKTGMDTSATWRGVLISTGEESLLTYSQAEGTRGRTISLSGRPLGEGNADLAENLERALARHHGQAGPRLVQWLLEHRDRWSVLRELYEQAIDDYGSRATSPIARRLAPHLAVLAVAARLLHRELGVRAPEKDPLEMVFERVQQGGAEGDRGKAALDMVYDLAMSHPDRFWALGLPRTAKPAAGWLGRWEGRGDSASPDGTWTYIEFVPDVLNEFLRSRRFNPEAIMREWGDRGWLVRGDGANLKHKSALDSGPCRLIRLRREAFEL